MREGEFQSLPAFFPIAHRKSRAFGQHGTFPPCPPFCCALADRGHNRETKMPKETHTKAAESHEKAAKAHRTAAEHHGAGDHGKAHEHSTAAHAASQTAQGHSTDAHSKSAAHGKKAHA